MNSWLKEIEHAQTGDEVVSVARDYCSLIHPRELEPLPQECREILIEAEADIPRLRRKLSDGFARVRDPDADIDRIRALVDYLSRADDRLGELRGSH